jgi:hypothetical protein
MSVNSDHRQIANPQWPCGKKRNDQAIAELSGTAHWVGPPFGFLNELVTEVIKLYGRSASRSDIPNWAYIPLKLSGSCLHKPPIRLWVQQTRKSSELINITNDGFRGKSATQQRHIFTK